MRVGAVVAAAGLSTRMRAFKQLMRLGEVSFAERVARGFQQAGVRNIVVVTGHRAAELERQLQGMGLVFLRNERYAATQMLDSVKIGLGYMRGRCDRVFFCPVDVPLFSVETLRLELARTENVVFPVCHGRLGHPILLDAAVIPHILAYEGEGGLKGALDSLKGQTACMLPVGDEGAVLDADTPEDLERLTGLLGKRGGLEP